MSNKVTSYVVVKETCNYTISTIVCSYLKQDWQPYGPPFSVDGIIHQALVKY